MWVSLHDVGKDRNTGCHHEKAGRLHYEEYEEPKTYAKIGAQMLEGMKFIGKRSGLGSNITTSAGTARGFPDGLKGEEIPIEARIIACADSFSTP